MTSIRRNRIHTSEAPRNWTQVAEQDKQGSPRLGVVEQVVQLLVLVLAQARVVDAVVAALPGDGAIAVGVVDGVYHEHVGQGQAAGDEARDDHDWWGRRCWSARLSLASI